MMPSDDHLNEQAEAAVIHASEVLSNVSGNFIIFAKLDNGKYARRVTAGTNADCVSLMSACGIHFISQVSRIAEIMGEQADLREFREQEGEEQDT